MRARADKTPENQLGELSREVKDDGELPKHGESKSEFTVSFIVCPWGTEGWILIHSGSNGIADISNLVTIMKSPALT